MISRKLTATAVATLVSVAMSALSMGPASAFTLGSPSISQHFASTQIDKVWAHKHCWVNHWGHMHCHYW